MPASGKAFTHNHNLLGHQRIHLGEKPYKFDTCGNAFTQYFSLLRHQRIQIGENPYKCDACGKAFSQNPNYGGIREYILERSLTNMILVVRLLHIIIIY